MLNLLLGRCARSLVLAAAGFASATSAVSAELQIGVEYMLAGHANFFSTLGVPAVKPLPENFSWGKMQSAGDQPIDFSVLDQFVRDCQGAGFSEIVLGLRSINPWASKSTLFNPVPKPEHEAAYSRWVQSIVERYDGDGQGDLPGLRFPVRFYEIGVEFSSYEPEPVADYLRMLDHAHRAVKAASPDAQVLHAAFLTTTAFKDHPQPGEYESAFAAMDQRIAYHSLADIRAVLDRPDLFDLLNLHALADPTEIEDMVAWLRWESARRGYTKPIMISDTSCEPFIAWGPADTATGPPEQLGLVIPPATEADRPRLAAYFTKLLDGDAATSDWVRGFAASDMAKKIVIAAERGVVLLNAAFTEDLELLKLKALHAGAGNAAWGGMARIELRLFQPEPVLAARYPNFFAVAQVQRHLRGYRSIRRVAAADPDVRIYHLRKPDTRELWIAWLAATKVFLPGDAVPTVEVELDVGEPGPVTIEQLLTVANGSQPETKEVPAATGQFKWPLTPTPVFFWRTDRDADGLPDGWEQAHGLNLLEASDASLDSDRDGQTNREEYVAGTDPRVSLSALRFDGIARDPNASAVILRFTARADRAYRIEDREAFDDGTWRGLIEVPVASADRVVDLTAPPSAARTRFYRLAIADPP
ncbi:MAG: hypothetical protein HYY24_13090 [Verrucomicrobia bacterium]|nr:hypothetical protein [Verrucomicrobiota bacterium]